MTTDSFLLPIGVLPIWYTELINPSSWRNSNFGTNRTKLCENKKLLQFIYENKGEKMKRVNERMTPFNHDNSN